MKKPWPVHCETAELAVEASTHAEALGLSVAPDVSSDALDAAAHTVRSAEVVVCLLLAPPDPAKLIAAAEIAGDRVGRLVLGIISDGDGTVRGLSLDLGIPCVVEVSAAMTCAALTPHTDLRPWRAQARKLSAADRLRVEASTAPGEKSAGRLVPIATARIGWEKSDAGAQVALGHAVDAGRALIALRLSEPLTSAQTDLTAHDAATSREVLFGPRRLLSDPASKAALAPFGLPLPQEELCASPSRAAAEAARIGFPVRISLASPDLRVWDHADLCVDGVDNAARVRDVYRQLTLVAEKRGTEARVLGVTVTATTLAHALLRVQARLVGSHVLLRVSFADPHGAVARDAILTIWPASTEATTRSLTRLSASVLILGESAPDRARNAAAMAQLFGQIGAFMKAFPTEVERVDLHPLALLVGGGAEVREAAIQVTDAFSRGLA